MSYGIKIYDEYGAVVMGPDDLVSRIVYSTIAKAYEDGSVWLGDTIDGRETFEISIGLIEDKFVMAHYVYRDGNTIYWEWRGRDEDDEDTPFPFSGDSKIHVFVWE